MNTQNTFLGIVALVLLTDVAACGRKKDFDKGDQLEAAVLGGEGGGRVQSGAQTVTQAGTGPLQVTTKVLVKKTIRVPKARPTYNIVPVTQIVTATSGIPSDWSAADMVFQSVNAPAAIGAPALDTQTPFHFDYDWPANNYQFSEASLVIDTSRDSSGTEGIFVDGVFTGNPPLTGNSHPSTSSKILYALYQGSGAATPNTYYIDFSSAHYKRLTSNTLTLALVDLLSGSPLTPLDVLQDGTLNVTTGDDSPVYQAYLVINGLTTSGDALSCSQSSDYTFGNTYIHNDGNTIGQAAFAGTMGTPYTSWGAVGTYPAFEFNFDAPLPKVDVANIEIDTASLSFDAAKKSGSTKAAIVINGIGIAQTGFVKTAATSAVESWDDTATAAFDSFLAGLSTGASGAAATLDLINLFGGGAAGKTKVRSLLAQGKLNVSIAGNFYAHGTGATAARTALNPIDGPELVLTGTYNTQICNVPNNPDSPLTQNGVVDPPVEYEDKVVEEWVDSTTTMAGTGDTVVVTNDGAGPLIGSLQTLQITSNSATVVWSTDEGGTSQVIYGIGAMTAQTAEDANLSTFHQVKLTGLSPYKYYNFQVITKDRYGNESRSPITVFTTLR